ncbi:hypothetical protein [Photobacterium halotolerans]|uniref:Flavodoxin n=1 Tax=Photobacterium halotolerans TaxID=265726 RepID=A0A0F5VCZ2_9GAMM|nr:hypothetical protein [Photobacterium halotolerans]KKC99359.1 hypothetical protein KY46_13350 [Photobacterium halotolerans]
MHSQITQLPAQKNAWMASHITDAEFPTALSKQGLALYHATQNERAVNPVQASDFDSPSDLLSVYPVDCHPLTIRFSLVHASQWQGEESEAVIEFLTQIMLETDCPAQLFVGFYQGKPAACGMLFTDPDNPNETLVSDIGALALPNHNELVAAMTNWLIQQASEKSEKLWLG